VQARLTKEPGEEHVVGIKIAIVNRSTVIPDADVESATKALQRQVTEHFAPAYGYGAELIFVGKDNQSPDGYSQLLVLDTSDDASALGYHDLTEAGFPLGKSFAKSDIDGGYSWTVTLSHELLEMLADPDLNLSAQVDGPDGRMKFYGYEICDAVEGDQYGYLIDGVKVSDFVFPAYFEGFHKDGKQYDYRNLLKLPCPAMLDDGYLSVMDPSSGRGWSQIYARRRSAEAMRPRLGSRRERRRTPRAQWLKSRNLNKQKELN
jgi:hypothetical protein